MEKGYMWGSKVEFVSLDIGAEEDKAAVVMVPSRLPPQAPKEPMEYLARSWSMSASEISKALVAGGKKNNFVVDRLPEMMVRETLLAAAAEGHHHHHHHHHHKRPFSVINSIIHHHISVGKWFHHHHHHHHHQDKEPKRLKITSKEKERADNARVHAAVSVAGVAAAIMAIAAGTHSDDQSSETMSAAMASATELLASHCIEVAEQAGADHELVTSAIDSAIDVKTAGDLMTLTAAAATALRGAAALKQRLQRETKNSAAVTPQCGSPDIWCKEGELLKRTGKGVLRWKRVSVYINKKSQVIVKLKSKHLGGALSKKKKSIVHGVLDEMPAWPGRERESMEGKAYFGLRTAQGLMEFECENGINKQKWVASVKNLLQQVAGNADEIEHSLESLELK